MVTDLYIDGITRDLVVTIANPILDSYGNSLGGIFTDLSLDFVVELVSASSFCETGKSFIFDHNSILVACMDYEFIGKSYTNLGLSSDELTSEMINSTGSLIWIDAMS